MPSDRALKMGLSERPLWGGDNWIQTSKPRSSSAWRQATGIRHTNSLLFLLPGESTRLGEPRLQFPGASCSQCCCLGKKSPRKGPGWTTHLSWPLNSQLFLSYGSSTLGCTINAHYALCLHSGFCQGLYHLKNISAFQSLMRQSAVRHTRSSHKGRRRSKNINMPKAKGQVRERSKPALGSSAHAPGAVRSAL